MRRVVIISIVVVLLIILGILGFLFLKNRNAANAPTGTTGGIGGGLSGGGIFGGNNTTGETGGGLGDSNAQAGNTAGGAQKFGVIAQNPVLDYFVDAQNGVTIIQPDGAIVRIVSGEVATSSGATIADLVSASFSSDGQKILALFGSKKSPQLSVFDVRSKTWTVPAALQPFPNGLQSPTWSPTGYTIAYFAAKGSDQSVLTTLDVNDPNAKPLELLTLHEQDLNIIWSSQNEIMLEDKPSAFAAGSLWKFDIQKKILASIIQNKPGLETLWNAPSKRGLLFISGAHARGGTVSLVDNSGNELRTFDFLTLPSKCALESIAIAPTPAVVPTSTSATSTKKGKATSTPVIAAEQMFKTTLYCGFPRNPANLLNKPLPDAYEMRTLFMADDFYKVDTDNGILGTIFTDPNQNVDAENVKLANSKFFFVNRLDHKLYVITL